MADPRKLKDAVQKALEGGKHKKAADLYLELASTEPTEGLWPHRAGEMLKKVGDKPGAARALREAADRYSRRGFLLKAIAVCKLILEVDPAQTEAQELLARLYADPQAAPLRPARHTPTIPPGKGLESAPPLETLMPDAKAGPTEGITEIPLEIEVDLAPEPPRKAQPAPAPAAPVAAAPAAPAAPGAPPAPAAASEEEAIDVEAEAEEAIEIEPELEAEVAAEAPAPVEEGRAAMQMLPSTPLFSSLDEQSLRKLIQSVQMVQAPAGFPVTTGGEEADSLYVIVTGVVAIRHEGREGEEMLGEGDFFGEVGLLEGVPRPAMAVAVEDSDVLEIPRAVIGEIIDRQPDFLRVILRLVRERLLGHLMRSSPLFADYAEEERKAIAGRFRFVEVRPDTLLIREGERTLGLCLMMAGHAEVLTEGEGLLATLGPGDIFGEMSLLSQGPAVASIRSMTKCWVLLLQREDFDEMVLANPRALEFVTALAEERRRINAAIASGQLTLDEARLPLS
jgi:CRP-like cAMP-binding protein